MTDIYFPCLKCRKSMKGVNVRKVKRNGQVMTKGNCIKCGTKVQLWGEGKPRVKTEEELLGEEYDRLMRTIPLNRRKK